VAKEGELKSGMMEKSMEGEALREGIYFNK